MRLFLANTTQCSMRYINVRPKVDGRSTCTLMCRMKPKTKLEVRDVLINITARRPPKGPKNAFLSLVTLTFGL